MSEDFIQVIDNLVVGDDYDFDILVSNIPAGQTIISGWLTIKEYESDLDTSAIIQKGVSTALTSTGQITISGVYTRVYISLGRTDTRLLNSAGEYPYDIQVQSSVNKLRTVEKGVIQPIQDVTRIQ